MRGLVVFALVVTLPGCLRDNLGACGDLLCPSGKVCAPSKQQCVDPDQLEACDGRPDGAVCTPTTSAPGTCLDGVCSQYCGDGVLEIGEACDDSNSNPFDGCDVCRPTSWQATAVVGGNADATRETLALPVGVTVDRHGNVYVADANNHRVRRIDTTGVITTVAGTGVAGFSGDGGAATSAQLAFPAGVAIDGLGNVFIADTSNHRIRRVDTGGLISTVAGTGTTGSIGDGGAATSAQLASPRGVTVDGLGNIYIADTNNHRIRRITTTGVITTLAGTTTGYSGDGAAAVNAQLALPASVALDGLGNVYVADTDNDCIRRIDTAGIITTIAGTGTFGGSGESGPATSMMLAGPTGVAIDGSGNVYVADRFDHRIRRIDTAGFLTTIAGTGTLPGFSGDGGPATSASLWRPTGVAVDGLGNVYFSDQQNHRLRRIDTAGIITTIAGSGGSSAYLGDGGPATSARLGAPVGVAIDSLGNVYIGDTVDHRVRKVDATGVITAFAGTGNGLGVSALGDGGPATSAEIVHPGALGVDAVGNVYVADFQQGRIRRIDTAGIITTVAGGGADTGEGVSATSASLPYPVRLAVDGPGNLYVSTSSRIRRIDTNGIITTIVQTGVGTMPLGVAVDGGGNVYVADTDNHRILRLDTLGVLTTFAGTGTPGFSGDGGPATSAELTSPTNVGADGPGNVYVVANGRVRRIDTTGIITTILGDGTSGISGDGGPAASALAAPFTVAPDALGNLYIAEPANSRVRRIDASGTIWTIAGRIDPEGMGPLAQAHLADPRAIVVGAPLSFIAGGSSGTVQAIRGDLARVEVVAGRYPQSTATSQLARFRDLNFGAVSGIAYDATARLLYLSEANQIHVVTIVDPADANTWTIATLANASDAAGFADGAAATAQFRQPSGLFLDAGAHQLYVADAGNHAVRAIDLTSGVVRTIAGVPATLGYDGDGGSALAGLLFDPQAVTRCSNGDVFIADTGNNRVRRIDTAGVITTVLGDGGPASSGEGRPASEFPVNAPRGLACDMLGNLYVTSATAVREVTAGDSGTADGTGDVITIYGAQPRDTFPASVTSCLTGLVTVGDAIQVTDSCTGLLIELACTRDGGAACGTPD